jgi:hypothetical protein
MRTDRSALSNHLFFPLHDQRTRQTGPKSVAMLSLQGQLHFRNKIVNNIIASTITTYYVLQYSCCGTLANSALCRDT